MCVAAWWNGSARTLISHATRASLEHATPELKLDVRIQQLGWHRVNAVHSNVKGSWRHGSDGQQI